MKNKIIIIGISLTLLTILFLGSTYAYWKFSETQNNSNVIASKCFDLSFIENNSNINLNNAYPITDEDGSKTSPYTFSLKNNCDNELTYQINLETLENSTLKNDYIKVKLNEEATVILKSLSDTNIAITNALNSKKVSNGTILAQETKTFELRIWLDGSVTADNEEAMNKTFYSKISIEGTINNYKGKYTEDILNGTDPVIKGELTPVTIENDGTVKKADIEKEWYSYEKKNWANAIILEDETKIYQNGEVIPESNIESYFVWIPRYKYQIFNDGLYYGLSDSITNGVQEIKVVFENKDTQISDGVRKGSWLSHPAFTSFNSNGMWVGKFETGYKGAKTTSEAEQENVDSTKIQVKPNTYSWRGIQVSNAHLNSYNYQQNLDSHMMKNTEWGAVTYLQHSEYGSKKKIRINNNSSFITGYAAVTEPTCGYTGKNESCNIQEKTSLNADGTYTKRYNTEIGYLASTTGNISGIYDMSGGTWEWTMSIVASKNGNPLSGKNQLYNSGFNGLYGNPNSDGQSVLEKTNGINFPKSKYYDLYAYSENNFEFARRILGDAVSEFGPFFTYTNMNSTDTVSSWYQSTTSFPNHTYSFFVRGEEYAGGNLANITSFGRADGAKVFSSTTNRAFRIVLMP